MKTKALILKVLLFLPFTVLAQSPVDIVDGGKAACYGREYTSDHMTKHPKQTVKTMKVKFYRDAEFPESFLMDVGVMLKREIKNSDQYDPYRTSMFCYDFTSEGMHCAIECDGGQVDISWKTRAQPDGSILFINHGFYVYGGCGEMDENDEPVEGRWLAPSKGGDDVFRLFPLSQENCSI